MHFTKNPFPKETSQAAKEFCQTARMKAKSLALLKSTDAPATFFKRLLEKEHYTDAIRMMAHRLSRRQAIWWGALCLEHDHGPEMTVEESAALEAVVAWVLEPNDETRRKAGDAAKIAKAKTPAGSLAKAVFWSGGSLSKPQYPAVPPPPDICGRSVASSILLLAANHRGHETRQTLRKEFLDLGFLIEQGELSWEETVSPSTGQPIAVEPLEVTS